MIGQYHRNGRQYSCYYSNHRFHNEPVSLYTVNQTIANMEVGLYFNAINISYLCYSENESEVR